MKTEQEIINILNSKIRFSNNYINSFNDYVIQNPLSTYLNNQIVYNHYLNKDDIDTIIKNVNLEYEEDDFFDKMTVDYLLQGKNYITDKQVLDILKKINLNIDRSGNQIIEYLITNNTLSDKVVNHICKHVFLPELYFDYELLFKVLTQSQINIIKNRREV